MKKCTLLSTSLATEYTEKDQHKKCSYSFLSVLNNLCGKAFNALVSNSSAAGKRLLFLTPDS